MKQKLNQVYARYHICEDVVRFVEEREKNLVTYDEARATIRTINQLKVNRAMQEERLSSADFGWNTGYGYGDRGRDKTEAIYAKVFHGEDALVRPLIVSGTHAIYLTLSGLLKPGQKLLYINGIPYDTLLKVIGVKGDKPNTLASMGIDFDYVPLKNQHEMDEEAILNAITSDVGLIAIQRSMGYSHRRATTIGEMESIIQKIRTISDVPIFVDNCYGEFTEEREPLEVGADIIAGSLIKNPGAGIALSGGYVIGKRELVHAVAARLTAPGLDKDCGLTFGMTRTILQGLYFAPNIVYQATKTALLVAECFTTLGYDVVPAIHDPRSDIVSAITFEDPELVKIFCQEVQHASVVDAYVTPEAWEMPGYEDQVIMASGGFVEGSSIELSADGPMRPPYQVFFQGGLSYDHGRMMVMQILQRMLNEGRIALP